MTDTMTFEEFMEAWKAYRTYCQTPGNKVAEPIKRKRRSRNSPALKAGHTWTDQEKRDIVADYRSGMTLRGMARKYGRSIESIRTRLFHYRDGLVRTGTTEQLFAVDMK